MNKDEWAEAAIRGDETALLQRIEQDKHQMYGIAYSYMRNESDALEVMQETVCRIWTKRHTLREPKFFTTWAIRILIRVCMDARKKQTRERPTEYIEEQYDMKGKMVDQDAAARLDMAAQIQMLPVNYRMVITLKYYRDMTITEIAELLEKPDGTIRTWLNKALKGLRADMADMKEEIWNERGQGDAVRASQSGAAK
ncbi:sigma-70 family RNA polymerase sigma factor [Bacillus sp. FJAT-28004]|uniref:sigma-70 family RNA polymerase sigma factor n=1 Tax=Bacillus sp. FJAT-28004 TaxID=1679165 RepID=UPI0006B59B36|nr:sigma-70 family RNA polymerase sigma factor [Bacillus sp. FJAT-28004]